MWRYAILFSTASASLLTAVRLAVVELPPSPDPPAAVVPPGTPAPPGSHPEVVIAGEMLVHADWLDWLGDSFWRGFRERPARRERLDSREEPTGRRSAPQTTF